MKQLLDLVPAAAFFLGWLLYDIYVATGAVIAALFAVVAAYWLLYRRLHKMHLVAAVAAGVFGSLTLLLRDPVFNCNFSQRFPYQTSCPLDTVDP